MLHVILSWLALTNVSPDKPDYNALASGSYYVYGCNNTFVYLSKETGEPTFLHCPVGRFYDPATLNCAPKAQVTVSQSGEEKTK